MIGPLVTIPKNEMVPGPKLLHERYYHGSGVFINEGVEIVVVAGGFNGHEFLTSTEIWIPSSGSGWIEGNFFVNYFFSFEGPLIYIFDGRS